MNKIAQMWSGLKALTSMQFPRAASWFFGWTDVGESDYARKVGDGLTHNVIMSPVLWITGAFPEAQLVIRKTAKDGKREIIRTHEMLKLMARPNAFYSGEDLIFAVLISYLFDGNGYVAKVRGRGNKVAELWYMPHWMIEPCGTQTDFITHYEYRPNGSAPIRIEAQDMIHFRFGLDPRDPRKGFGRLRTLICEIFTDAEAAGLVSALLKNKGVPGMVVSPEKDVQFEDGQEEALKQAVKDKTTGSRRGEPLVLSAAVKIQQFGFSPAEMDLGAIRNIPEERVCSALQLPAAVVGFGTGNESTKVGATMREYVKLAWTGCMLPTQRRFAAELTRSLLPDFEKDQNAEAYYDTSEVEALQPNRLEVAQACEVEIRAGMATRGEARAKLGYTVTPADDIFYVPFNALETPRDQSSMDPAADPAAPAAAKSVKRLTRAQARILRAKDIAFKRFEPRMRKRVQELLERMGADAERAYLDMNKSADDALRIETLFSRIDLPKYKSDLRGIFASHYVEVHNDNVGTLAGLGIPINLPDGVQIEILSAGGNRAYLTDLTTAGRARAFRVLADAREQGLGIPETARLLRDAIPGGTFLSPKTRAEVIARTETRYAQTTSSLRAYKTIAGVSEVMMIDGRLGPTDEDCEQMDGQLVSFAEAARLIDQEHPNGTRDLVPVFGEEA